LIRRIDPQGRSLGTYFRDELAKPLAAEFYIGLPDTISDDQLAKIEGFRRSEIVRNFRELPLGMVLSGLWPNSLVARSVRNLPFSNPAEIGGERYRHLEIPSANGIGQARAIAKIYSALIGCTQGVSISDVTRKALIEPSRVPTLGGRDTILKIDTRYGFGFSRPGSAQRFGTDPSSFGAFGAGGSFGMADPTAQLGYAYVTNKMGFRLFDDPRELAVRRACYACLEKSSTN
jgi:CubicO group peptidase (beta-lactamase class C family)